MDLNTEFKLEIYKCKNVKTPTKAWEAAGWDFYIPENLSIFNFTKDPNQYLDSSIIHNKNEHYVVPLIFTLISPNSSETTVKIILQWNEFENKYKFYIDEANDETAKFTALDDINNEFVRWLTEKTTVISKIEILPLGKVVIPSGIHVKLPKNIFLAAENKSGIASKRNLIVGAKIIDYDYEGEIHINLLNCSNNNVIIRAGEKIVQFVRHFQPIMTDVVEYSSKEELYKGTESKRGEGGFGSSGIK